MNLLIPIVCGAGLLAFQDAGTTGQRQGDAKNKGSLTLSGTTYQLTSALAYETTVFRKKEIVVILSVKPLDTAKLKQSFKKNGNDDDFFPTEPHVKLALNPAGELMQLSIHASGANILRSGDPNVKTSVTIKDGVAKGTAGTLKPDEFRNKPLAFDVSFDVALLQLTPGNPAPAPPVEPKTTLKPKTTPAAPGQVPLVTENELRFEGKLTQDSPNVLGKPAEIHRVRMSPNKTYQIDLESSEYDAYLRILDSNGTQLASDDDGGEGLNSRIRFTPTKDDNYQVVATRFGSDQGAYVLKIRVVREEKQPLAEKEQRFEGTLAQNSPKVQNKPAQIHRVRMSPNKTYLIDMESSDFDTYLRIFDSGGRQVASDDDGGENRNARIRFTPTREDNYQIVATRFGQGVGSYLLKVRVVRVGEER